eukprot:531713-Pleurochrysis_carterae.AAC.5
MQGAASAVAARVMSAAEAVQIRRATGARGAARWRLCDLITAQRPAAQPSVHAEGAAAATRARAGWRGINCLRGWSGSRVICIAQ